MTMMMLLIDLLLGLLLLAILYKSHTSAYATPLTSFGGKALFGLFTTSWLFVLLFGSITLTINVVFGASLIIIRNALYTEAKLLEI